MLDLPLEPWASEPGYSARFRACFDDETVVVYQAYSPAIADAALREGHLGGGGFSFDRMSWVKPSFFWTMHRSGWATSAGQERILAFRVPRARFDDWLCEGVSAKRDRAVSKTDWRARLATATVLLQSDPDYGPGGQRLRRRAVQIGLRGLRLRTFAERAVPEDLTPFVTAQRSLRGTPELRVPVERSYPTPC